MKKLKTWQKDVKKRLLHPRYRLQKITL